MLVVIKDYNKAEPAWAVPQESIPVQASMWELGYILSKGARELNKLIEKMRNEGRDHTDEL